MVGDEGQELGRDLDEMSIRKQASGLTPNYLSTARSRIVGCSPESGLAGSQP